VGVLINIADNLASVFARHVAIPSFVFLPKATANKFDQNTHPQ